MFLVVMVVMAMTSIMVMVMVVVVGGVTLMTLDDDDAGALYGAICFNSYAGGAARGAYIAHNSSTYATCDVKTSL